MGIHHTAIKTRNITLAMEFYALLGFEPVTKFRAGPARAAWLELSSTTTTTKSSKNDIPSNTTTTTTTTPYCRLELIEVPSYMLKEPPGQRRRALDLMTQQELLGANHFALDVTSQIQQREFGNLTSWIQSLNQTSLAQSNRMLRMALWPPQQQIIGQGVYELAFLYDADGALVELLNLQTVLEQPVTSGWETVYLGEYSNNNNSNNGKKWQ